MAVPERDTVYTTDGTNTNRSVYTRESSSTGWFVGIIVALALLAIGYLVFSANSGPSTPASTNVDINNTPAVTAPADPATAPAQMEQAPAAGTEAAPMTDAAPAGDAAAPAADAPAAGAAAPATTPAQ